MIYYSNPYSTEKNIGKAINDFCRIVPKDDDWIVIQDGDMMYLTPDWGTKIKNAIEKHGKEYQIFGCYTNRLANLHQLHNHMCNNNHDVRHHYRIALGYNNNEISEVNSIAGFFMCFQKKTWKQLYFDENCRNFDTKFCNKASKKGFKIGLIQSIYVYHSYRIWSDDPANYVKHLEK